MASTTVAGQSSPSSVTDLLQRLVRGENLTQREARVGLEEILRGNTDDNVVASFLTAITAKGETTDEMSGFIDAMMATALTFDLGPDTVDIVGTGGDQLHTVNISTMAALAVAGAGVKVAKHGNRAASSSVGSADVLEALGVRLDADESVVRRCVDEAGIGFLFAPVFHHALGNLSPIRRKLPFRTIFNVLGPLANPALVKRSVIGIANESLIDKMAHVLVARGVQHAILVHGDDGLDELSLGTWSTLHVVTPTTHDVQRINAGDVLGRQHDVRALRGGDVTDNVNVVLQFLDGRQNAVFDVVCANAALGLMVAGTASTLEEGFNLASASVLDGSAKRALEVLVSVSTS